MNGILDENTWACQEFHRAQFGDVRRTERLVSLAEQAARTPAGAIAAVFREAAAREAAFRFVENDSFCFVDVAHAAHTAAALRASAYPFVFVPLDGSSLLLSDPDGKKGLGGVGPWNKGGRGLQTMTAIATSPDGVPLGILGQSLWARLCRSPAGKKDPRLPHQRESQAWLDVMHDAQQRLVEQAPDTVPWFQLDRGGDSGRVILRGLTLGVLFTVRAAHDRSVMDEVEYRRLRLWKRVRAEPAQSLHLLPVQGGPKRSERLAMMSLRHCAITLTLRDEEKQKVAAKLWAVHVREVGSTPCGEAPIEWLLLTNHPVDSVEDACLVVDGYAQRWRIEQFHKLWKSDGCRVEQLQLRSSVRGNENRAHRVPVQTRPGAAGRHGIQSSRDRRRDPFAQAQGSAARRAAQRGGSRALDRRPWRLHRQEQRRPFGQEVLARGLDYIAPVAQLIAEREM